MKLSSKAVKILEKINQDTKLGDLRKIAKDIKKDHQLAIELWSTQILGPRLLAILIMDKNALSQDFIDELFKDMLAHQYEERNQLADWLMANQLTKSKNHIALVQSWENSSHTLQRRIFWYYQGRLRWVGQTPPDNTKELLSKIESRIMKEEPEVQWAMNFTVGWIGVYDDQYRTRCTSLGEKTELYKDEVVSKGCTPSYLPAFIQIEANKRNL